MDSIFIQPPALISLDALIINNTIVYMRSFPSGFISLYILLTLRLRFALPQAFIIFHLILAVASVKLTLL